MMYVVLSFVAFFITCLLVWKFNIECMVFYIVLASLLPSKFSGAISLILLFLYFCLVGMPIEYFVAFCLIGVVIQCVCDRYRSRAEFEKVEFDFLKEKYDIVKSANDANEALKDEYARRLLLSEQSFPRIYSMIKGIMSVDKDRIFMDVVKVVSDLINTDTVAVYIVDGGSKYLRLVCSMNEKSQVGGRSFSLVDQPKLYDKILRGEIHRGGLKDDINTILPIKCDGRVVACIVIKHIPFESESQYSMSMLRTLSMLLGDSISHAIEYEKMRFGDLTVLGVEAFKEKIALAVEKKERGLAEYCLCKVSYTTGAVEDLISLLRVTDIVGWGESGELLVLLSNTTEADLEFIKGRLSCKGVILC